MSYMDGLGLRNDLGRRYFNTSLLRLNRGGWPELCAEALHFLCTQSESCHFADQSALNAASNGAHTLLSLRWNFPIFLRNCGVEDEIGPAMYHFMAQPKPWHGEFRPWDRRFTMLYATLLTAHPALQGYVQRMPGIRRTRYLLQQNAKWAGEAVAWRYSVRRQRSLDYEQQTEVSAFDGG
jgi:lipopolysaccharide biosynthesis glycosyltransferase